MQYFCTENRMQTCSLAILISLGKVMSLCKSTARVRVLSEGIRNSLSQPYVEVCASFHAAAAVTVAGEPSRGNGEEALWTPELV
jgi:hypothetical protein